MFYRKPQDRALPVVQKEHNLLITEKVNQIASGEVDVEDMDIPVADHWQPTRAASWGPMDHNILAEVILSNTPAIDLNEKCFGFLRKMLVSGYITEKQRKFLTDLYKKHITVSDDQAAA